MQPVVQANKLSFAHINAARAAMLLIILAATIVVLVLTGWLLQIEVLKRIVPQATAMNPLTAVSLSFAALALWLRRDGGRIAKLRGLIASLATLLVVLVGLLKLADMFLGTTVCPDDFLFASQLNVDQATPNRISLNAAAGLMFLGLGIASLDRPRGAIWPATPLLLVPTLLLALAAIIGYLFDTSRFYALKDYIPMALHTAITLLLLSLAALLVRPDGGVTSVVLADSPGGRIARLLLPVCVGIPTLLGWLELKGQMQGLYGLGTGTTLLVLTIIIVLGSVVVLVGKSLHHSELARRKLEATLKARLEEQVVAAQWSTRLSRLDEILRSSQDALQAGAADLLAAILDALDAPVGLIHLLRIGSDGAQLTAYAAHACSTPLKDLPTLRLGEGLAGQCALEQRPIALDALPADYFRLRTALVDVPLSHVLLMPVLIGRECVGVLELAALCPFNAAQQHFVESAARILAFLLYREQRQVA